VKDLLALKDLNFTVKKGEFVCIIGDVGSGKSSLLATLIGDLKYLHANQKNKIEDKACSDEQVIKDLKEFANM